MRYGYLGGGWPSLFHCWFSSSSFVCSDLRACGQYRVAVQMYMFGLLRFSSFLLCVTVTYTVILTRRVFPCHACLTPITHSSHLPFLIPTHTFLPSSLKATTRLNHLKHPGPLTPPSSRSQFRHSLALYYQAKPKRTNQAPYYQHSPCPYVPLPTPPPTPTIAPVSSFKPRSRSHSSPTGPLTVSSHCLLSAPTSRRASGLRASSAQHGIRSKTAWSPKYPQS